MKNYFCASIAIFFVSGCHNLSIEKFDRSPYSMASGSKSSVIVPNGPNNWNEYPVLKKHIGDNPELNSAISDACTTMNVAMAPVLVPIAASVGKLLFDLRIDKNTRDIEKLKKAAQVTYSNRIIIPSDSFRRSSCAVVHRYNESEKSVGFVAVLKIESKNDGFVVTPSFVQANNTIAITKRPTEGNSAKISVSIAVSIKSVGRKNNLPALTAIGEGVTTVPNVDVGPTASSSCTTGCESTDLLPYIADTDKAMSVTFAITETGKVGVDFDEKSSEAKAIKEALGPALKDSLREYLKDEQ